MTQFKGGTGISVQAWKAQAGETLTSISTSVSTLQKLIFSVFISSLAILGHSVLFYNNVQQQYQQGITPPVSPAAAAAEAAAAAANLQSFSNPTDGVSTSTAPYYQVPQEQQQQEQDQHQYQGGEGDGGGASSSSSSSSSSPPSPTMTIFYNIYIPPGDPEGSARGYSIIEEQLKQIGELGQSTYSSSHPSEFSIHYITIGEEFNVEFMNNLCNFYQFASCQHVAHHDTGYEMVTQQAVLDFCIGSEDDDSNNNNNKNNNDSHIDDDDDDNDDLVVAYIHNKGSLHSSQSQSQLRRWLTGSTFAPQCVEELTMKKSSSQQDSSSSCNVCGANFMSVWTPIFWGNMWSAKCSYVKKLIPPFDVEDRLREAVESKPVEMTMDLYDDRAKKPAHGVGRFAAAQFVSTHPSLIPCSFSRMGVAEVDSFWAVDPPGPFERYVIKTIEPNMSSSSSSSSNRMREWYLLPGILWRFHVLYDELPPPDSWMWRHYPDGEIWKRSIEEMGFPEAFYHHIASETL